MRLSEQKGVLGRIWRRIARRRMDSREELYEFWTQEAPDGNVPTGYLEPVHRSRALAQLIDDLDDGSRILEVGCNVGRNLAYLHDQGWHHLTGVEISPHAVELLRQTYPQLAEARVLLGPAEETLADLPTDGFDLVFTMAVIEHIHPDSTAAFDEMARIGKRILSIEPRGHSSHRQFPHDVVEIFTRRGFELVSEVSMAEMEETRDDPALTGYTAWRFER